MRLFALTFALFIAWSTPAQAGEQRLPIQVDELTYLENVTTVTATKVPQVVYRFRVMVNTDYIDAEDIARFKDGIKRDVIQLACNDPDVRRILDDRISLKYVYYDKINTLITRVVINQSTCNQTTVM